MYRIVQLQEEKKASQETSNAVAVVASETRPGPSHLSTDHGREKQEKGKLKLVLPSDAQHKSAQEHQEGSKAKGAEGPQIAPGLDPSHPREDENRSSTRLKGVEGPQIAPATPPYLPRSNIGGPLLNEKVENLEAGISSMNEGDQDEEEAPSEEAPSAIEGVLAPTTEQARARMLEEAIEAKDVRRVTSKKKRMWITVAVVAIALVLAAVGGTLGAVLGRKGNDGVDQTEEPTPLPTEAPTPVPTSPRFAEVAALVEASFGTILDDDDQSSPQYKAADWIANVDTTFDLSDEARFRQRYAIVVFYYASGGDTSWTSQSNFLSEGVHECDWNEPVPPGSFVESENRSMGVAFCDEEDRNVIAIEMGQNNLTGYLPEELSALTSLVFFYVLDNNLQGTLPSSLFGLTNLEYLFMPFNNFTGIIPTTIGRLTKLMHIWFQDASFDSTIPSEIGLLSNLLSLNLVASSLHGMIPETLNRLTSLQLLSFWENQLTGTLTDSFPSAWPDLESLLLWSNQLNGTIPQNIDQMPNLGVIGLGDNSFAGPFPQSVANLPLLEVLNLESNLLTGSLPSIWRNSILHSSPLRQLSVSDNWLTGTLPTTLGGLTALEYLDVSNNVGINGTIPTELGSATNLWYLIMSGNDITGTVPTTFQHLTALRVLLLQENRLEGDISFLCDGNEFLFSNMTHMFADCFDEVVCPCCNRCCDLDDMCEWV